MKSKLLLLLLFSFHVSLAQKKDRLFYGGVFAGYATIKKPSVGIFGGYNVNKYIGAGIGFEMTGMDQLKDDRLNPAFPLYGEIRLSIQGKVIRPSLALQAGKYIYTNTASSDYRPSFYIDFSNSGNVFFGGSLIFTFPGNNKRSGFFTGYNFRAATYDYTSTIYNFRNPFTGAIEPTPRVSSAKNSEDIYLHVITVGYTF